MNNYDQKNWFHLLSFITKKVPILILYSYLFKIQINEKFVIQSLLVISQNL